MANVDRVLKLLAETGGPVCDDCASERTGVRPRQQVNQIAARLKAGSLIERGFGSICTLCGRSKKTSIASSASPPEAKFESDLAGVLAHTQSISSTDPQSWYWEGHVQAALRRYLEENGWTITAYANTSSKERGVDIAAERDGRQLFVEVKGYPEETYRDPARRKSPKRTRPASQARQWYSHALLSVMRLIQQHPNGDVALCLTDHPTYLKLIDATRIPLRMLGIQVFLVTPDGHVTLLQGLHNEDVDSNRA